LLSEDDVAVEELSESERVALCEELMAEQGEPGDSSWSNYLSTHPAMQERLERFLEYPL